VPSPVRPDEDWEEAGKTLFPPAPPEALELLRKASLSWADTDRALSILKEADRRYGEELQVVIAYYKFCFYKGLLREAIPFAERAAKIMGRRLGLPEAFEDVSGCDAPFSEYESGPRFILFAMKAVGTLHARLGETERGLWILDRIGSLDKSDRMGISPLVAVIRRGGKEEE